MSRSRRKSYYNRLVTWVSGKRIIVQLIGGIAIYYVISRYNVSLWWLLGFGTLLGIVWGKVFCRWMCPVGILMEGMMKLVPDESFRGMYQYHKVGCPIAWVSGWLNRISIFRIQLNADTCRNCGKCDDACYLPAIESKTFSLYKSGLDNPSENYSCSKCLDCVAKCPNGSLSYKPVFPYIKSKI